MKKKAAKALKGRELDQGTLTGEESWTRPSLVTTAAVTHFKTRLPNKASAVTIVYADNMDKVIFKETRDGKNRVDIGFDGATDEWVWVSKNFRGRGLNGMYLFRPTQPAFAGQEPWKDDTFKDEEEVDEKEKAKSERIIYQEKPDTDLYLYGRVLAVPGHDDACAYTIFSVVTGANPDAPETGMSYNWKDIYKTVQIPQFQYATKTFDMAGNLLCKSKQEGNVDLRPTFEVAAGVDVPHVVATCYPLLPKGSAVFEVLELGELFLLGV